MSRAGWIALYAAVSPLCTLAQTNSAQTSFAQTNDEKSEHLVDLEQEIAHARRAQYTEEEMSDMIDHANHDAASNS